jgi:hypothetical protein
MTITININDLTLVHKESGGVAKATLPDICLTPTGSGPVPRNYSNTAYSTDIAKGTVTVTADGGNMCAHRGSEFSKSIGDEAGSLGGVISGTNLAEATWLTWSPDVFLEGLNACRLTDKMLMNHGNTACLGGLYQLDLNTADVTLYVLCQIYCETWEKLKDGKNKRFSNYAKKLGRGKYKSALSKAAQKAFGKGASVALEKGAKVAVKKGLMAGTKRVAMSASYLQRKFRNAAIKSAAIAAGKGAGKKLAAKAVAKFIPIVNIASTVWDVYEIGKGVYDIAKTVGGFMNNYDVFRIRPDAMFTSSNGQISIYDYKFPGDSWDNNLGQFDLYTEAGAKKPTTVDMKSCNSCKKK